MKLAFLGDAGGDATRVRHSSLRASVIAPLLLAMVSLSAGPARAIDPALCGDDKVTEVPPFASGRDSNGCLLVDPGNGDPAVKFQYDIFHKTGISWHAGKPTNPGVDRVDANAYQWGNCNTKDSGASGLCTYLMWDTVLDNYLDPSAKNEDVLKLFYWGTEYYYIKDSKIINLVHCKGGAWTGPNGVSCSSSEVSSSHADGIQARSIPNNGGWLVIQDSIVSNVTNSAMLIQLQPQVGTGKGLLFQGVQFGQFNTPLGEANTWISDCIQRGKAADICDGSANGFQIGTNTDEVWFVNLWGNMRFRQFDATPGKIIVVNTGCGVNGCDGKIGYFEGYPHPLQAFGSAVNGNSTCPNGLLLPSPKTGTPVYCYTSVENALADHKAPPFIRHSATGWKTPPSGTTAPAPRPNPVVLQP
jgi:hypothetical protein